MFAGADSPQTRVIISARPGSARNILGVQSARAHLDTATSARVDLPLLLGRRGAGRGGRHAGKPLPSPLIAFVPPPRAPLAGREHPDYLTRFAPLSFQAKTDPSPRPSPLRKGRGGNVGSFPGNQGSWAGSSPAGGRVKIPLVGKSKAWFHGKPGPNRAATSSRSGAEGRPGLSSTAPPWCGCHVPRSGR